MSKRNIVVKFKLTEDEFNNLKLKSSEYSNVSQCIRVAIQQLSDISINKKLTMLHALCEYYKESNMLLSHISGNLNQAMKRANELYVAGLLTSEYFKYNLVPIISQTSDALINLHNRLLMANSKIK